MFRLANDENDSILSGVSTPVISSHKKNFKESHLKLISNLENLAANKIEINEITPDS